MEISPIAYIRSDFPEKFGVPRQSGLSPRLKARVEFEPDFRGTSCLKGLDGFSHLWLVWEFSLAKGWSLEVRPPRLGGNTYMGVFATRSPFRPNHLGLSCVKISSIDSAAGIIEVEGADLVDGTPIYDIKPYVRYTDSVPDAVCGWVDDLEDKRLDVVFPGAITASEKLSPEKLAALREVLSLDPRPSYQDDPLREYGMSFAGFNIRFKVDGKVLTVIEIE